MIPYPHQIRAIEHLALCLTKYPAAVDGSDTGTGKSATACWVAQVLGRKPFVVSPLAVSTAWKSTAEDTGTPWYGTLHYDLVRRERSPYFEWEIKNRRGAWKLPSDALLVFDEVHRCKGQGTLNAKLLKAAARAGVPTLCLSATLATNPLEMDALAHVLGWHANTRFAFRAWAYQHGVKDGPFAPYYAGGEAGLLALHNELYPERGIRVTADEVEGFPGGCLAPERIDVDWAKAKAVPEIRTALAELDTKRLEDTPQAVTQLLRDRQEAELGKLSWMVEQIQYGLEQRKSLVIMLNFRASLAALRGMLAREGISTDIIWGDMRRSEIDAAIAAFQANTRHVILAQIDSGGVGISLHDKHHVRPRECLISPGWSAVALKQALGRTRRLGGTDTVWRLVACAGTPELAVLKKLESKMRNMDTINDGDLAWGENDSLIPEEAKLF